VSSVAELIDALYPALSQNYHNLKWLRDRAILVPKNKDVHEITNQILGMLPGVPTEYKSIDTVVNANDVVNLPLCVACSRVGSPKNLFVLAPESETKNAVYNQVLS
jgi:hypothetical protein